MLVDSHCHLDKLELGHYCNDPGPNSSRALDRALEAAWAAGLSHILCIGIDLENIPAVLALADKYPAVFASVGVHPLYQESREPTLEELVKLSGHPKVIGVGETGLDYHYCSGDLGWQRKRFETHLQASAAVGKPVIIHTRDARKDTIAILKDNDADKTGGVFHCFTEDLAMAKQGLDLGFYISISGIVTFRNAHQLREVVKALPLDRVLIETDAPWLTPVPHRGKPNEPRYVKEVAQAVAEIKQVSFEEVAEVTTKNFFKLFKYANQA